MDFVAFGQVIQTIVQWLSIPLAVIIALVGYNFKSTLARIETLEIEVIKLQIQVARTEVNLQGLNQQLQQVDKKLDRILDRIIK